VAGSARAAAAMPVAGSPRASKGGTNAFKTSGSRPWPRVQARSRGSTIQTSSARRVAQRSCCKGVQVLGGQCRRRGFSKVCPAGSRRDQGKSWGGGPSGSRWPEASVRARRQVHQPSGRRCNHGGIKVSRKGGRHRAPVASTAPSTGIQRVRVFRSNSTVPRAIHGAPSPPSRASQQWATRSVSPRPRWSGGIWGLPCRSREIHSGTGSGPNVSG